MMQKTTKNQKHRTWCEKSWKKHNGKKRQPQFSHTLINKLKNKNIVEQKKKKEYWPYRSIIWSPLLAKYTIPCMVVDWEKSTIK